MERLVFSRRAALLGGLSLGLAGCEALFPPQPPLYSVRPGDPMLQLVHSESHARAFDPGPTLDGLQATGVTTFIYDGREGDTLKIQRKSLELRPRRQGGAVYVTVPHGYANQMVSNTGTTSRYPVDAYERDQLLGRKKPRHEKPVSESSRLLLVPIDPENVTTVVWAPFRIKLLPSPNHLLSYHIIR